MSWERAISASNYDKASTEFVRPVSKRAIRLFLQLKLLLVDSGSLIVGVVLATALADRSWQTVSQLRSAVVLLPIYLVAAISSGAYSTDALQRPLEGIRRALSALIFSVLGILLAAFFLKNVADVSRLGVTAGVASGAALLFVSRMMFKHHVDRATGGSLTTDLMLLDESTAPASFDKTIVMSAQAMGLEPDLSNPHMLQGFGVLTEAFDRVIVMCPPERRVAWSRMMKGANIDGEIVVDHFGDIGAIGVASFRGMDTLLVARRPLSLHERAQKRAFDLAITVPLIIALSPLFALIALAVRLDSPGPILFRQDRVGRGNRLFKVMKFRSMRVDMLDSTGARSTGRNDDRVTRVGRFIRATSIDELPQLFNVLIGDMSLVGPRPHALGSLAGERLFWEIDETYWHRHQLKPGITGLAQVRGFRGATVEPEDLTNRLQADMEYIQGWDIWRDFTILFNTARVVVHRNAF